MISRILVALDGSDQSARVFLSASKLARPFSAKLFLFRAIEIPPEFPASAFGSLRDPLPQVMEENAIRDLIEIAQGAPDVPIEQPFVGHGPPWRAILDGADAVDADLIVLGSHGYHGVDRILGTTAGKVANLSQRNVFIVHRTW